MAIHGLTRVRFEGDKAIIVAGPVPPDLAVRGLTETLAEAEPVHTPMTPVRHIPKTPNKPPRFVAPAPAAPVKESNSGS